MNLATTLLFYLLIGAAVAVAVLQVWQRTGRRNRWFSACTAIAFWPLYLPVLLQQAGQLPSTDLRLTPTESPSARDELAAAIGQVEAELELAMHSLDGWSDAALAR